MKQLGKHLGRWHIAIALGLAALAPCVHAATAEVEPNDSCSTAQAIVASAGMTVTGKIGRSDVDYFSFRATPGRLLQADVSGRNGGGGNIVDTLVGVYDSGCAQIAYNDYAGNDMESSAVFKVPADGVVIVAVAGYPDFDFKGRALDRGTYTLLVHEPTVPYVTGSVTESDKSKPLPAGSEVTLVRCPSAGYDICAEEMVVSPVAPDGSFAISLSGLASGYFQLRTMPKNHGTTYSKPFVTSATGATPPVKLVVGPLPVAIGPVTACERRSTDSDCFFDTTVTNVSSKTVAADVWTKVEATQSGASYGNSSFAAGTKAYTPARIHLAPGASTVVTQRLPVAGALTGIPGVADIYVAEAGKPLATIGHASMGFTVTDKGVSPAMAGLSQRARLANARREAAVHQGTRSATLADTATISGTVLNANTGTPVVDPFAPIINLYACTKPQYALCTTFMVGTQAAQDGSFRFELSDLPAGRYQLMALGGGSYDLGYSQTFAYGGTPVSGVDFGIAPKSIVVSNVQDCANAYALPAGSECSYSYDVRNATSGPRSLEVWTSIQVLPTGSPVNATQFSLPGDGGKKKTVITLQPGETRTVSDTLPLVSSLPAGVYYYPAIWMSTPGKPLEVWGFDLLPTVATVPAAGIR